MTVPDQSVPSPPCPSKDDVRAAYPVAVQLRQDASRGVFERFNIMLLTNSIILLGVVATLTSDEALPVPGVFLSLFGILVSWLWLIRIRQSRHAISEYDDKASYLEGCLTGITTFADVRAAKQGRRERGLARWLKPTRLDKIGAAELTTIPLTIIYGYLALKALDQLEIWPVAPVAESLFLGLGLMFIIGGIVLVAFAIYRGAKNIRDKVGEWYVVVEAIIFGGVLDLLGLLMINMAPSAI